MEKNLLVGNGINIQFGGAEIYSSSATMSRIVTNIKNNKYTILTENSLTPKEQLEILNGLTKIINNIKSGKLQKYADGLLMLMELDRIKRTYPNTSTITSVFLEDYFLAAEINNNMYKDIDGDELSNFHRKIIFRLLHQIIVDGIYNDGLINEVHKNFYPGIKDYLSSFTNIFSTNYDYNLEAVLENPKSICHLHGEFGKLAPEYDIHSLYYSQNKEECDRLIKNRVSDMAHIYGNTIMSWSWLDKYGELIEPDTKSKEDLFKSIKGQLEIVGLAPANDEHLFLLITQNPNIKSVTYYYFNDTDRLELPHHIKKPITFKQVSKLWNSMK